MPLSSLLGKRSTNGGPRIEAVAPAFAMPGGEVRISGSGLRPQEMRRPTVLFGEVEAPVVIGSEQFVVARVPEEAHTGPVTITTNGHPSNGLEVRVAVMVAENMHPVTNPAIDRDGNLYTTFSGSRGQKTAVSIYKVDTNYQIRPYLTGMMNPTSIAFDRSGQMYVSSRFDGTVYRVAPNGTMVSYAEGMGVATGIAFDRQENLFVGDRSGTIFKIAPDRQTFVYATLEPSISAYHLAMRSDGHLFVTGPTTSSFDAVYEILPNGESRVFFRGLGRPQGLAFDQDGNLYVAASWAGKRGIVRLTPSAEPSLAVSGTNLVGLAFAPGRSVVLATNHALYHLAWGIQGRSLFD